MSGSPLPLTRQRRTAACLVAAAMITVGTVMPIASADTVDDHGSGRAQKPEVTISVLSGRPDTVTGGDALVEVTIPEGTSLEDGAIIAGGTDQSEVFTADGDDHTLVGVVTDLPLGDSEIQVFSDDDPDNPAASLTVTNYPQEGPVISGPHQDPFLCQTEDAVQPGSGDSLGPPLDEDCSIEDRVDYIYQNKMGSFVEWPEDTTEYPEDLKYTTRTSGEVVPMIVRLETGTVNRAIFRTTVLHDPLTEEEPTPTAGPKNWNGSAIYMFGGGCPGGWYRQGSNTGDIKAPFMLGEGYALMTSSLNVFGNSCNDVLAAESAMMVKETFSERYGAIDNVIGWGSSGGADQSLQIADNYPGVLDAILISDVFPDVSFATVNFITDAKLLHEYFKSTDVAWTDAQKQAVTGLINYDTIAQVAGDQRTNPVANCDQVPEDLRYDPETNPTGARCDLFSNMRNLFGNNPDTGLPGRPMDNVGIQYGLEALNNEDITVDQFLDLNEQVGGLDNDSNLIPERTVADGQALRNAYQTGRMLNGGGGLAEIPIIDHRTFLDENDGGNIHARYHSLSLRQRLINANGSSENLVNVMRDQSNPQFSQQIITAMGQWLSNIDADGSEATAREKVIANKPADLQEGCYSRDGSNTFITEPLDRDPDSKCEQLYPSGSFPREVAGESVAADVAKCDLASPQRGDYGVEFSDEQWRRLNDIFDDGVCDYTVPGVEQQGLAATWAQFDGQGWTSLNDGAPADWSPTDSYHAGDRVTYNGSVWLVSWWSQGETPGSITEGAWQEIVETADGTAVWTPTRIFTEGDVAEYQGQRFEAKWWTRNQAPGDTYGPWKPIE